MSQLKHFLLFCLFCVLISACNNVQKETDASAGVVDIDQIKQRDTLIVGTLYGSTSYFLYRDEYMGFDFEVAQFLAKKMGRFMLPRYRAAAPIARTKLRVFDKTALFSCAQLKRANTA